MPRVGRGGTSPVISSSRAATVTSGSSGVRGRPLEQAVHGASGGTRSVSGTRRSVNAYAGRPVSAVNPPGRNFDPDHPAATVQIDGEGPGRPRR